MSPWHKGNTAGKAKVKQTPHTAKKEIIHGILSSTAPDDRPSAVKKEVILADKNPNYN